MHVGKGREHPGSVSGCVCLKDAPIRETVRYIMVGSGSGFRVRIRFFCQVRIRIGFGTRGSDSDRLRHRRVRVQITIGLASAGQDSDRRPVRFGLASEPGPCGTGTKNPPRSAHSGQAMPASAPLQSERTKLKGAGGCWTAVRKQS